MKEPIVAVRNLVKTYEDGAVKTYAVKGVSFDIFEGELVALAGPSGSGKSTILYQLGLLDSPTSGRIFIDGKETSKLDEEQKAYFRLVEIGYIFQQYELLSDLNVLENVYLPMMANFEDKANYEKKAKEILTSIGLGNRLYHMPNELSGGEQQRVSIARALVKDPDIILADEPTANLDSVNGDKIMELLRELNKKYKKTILVVNHEKEYEKYFDKIIRLKDGNILKIEKR